MCLLIVDNFVDHRHDSIDYIHGSLSYILYNKRIIEEGFENQLKHGTKSRSQVARRFDFQDSLIVIDPFVHFLLHVSRGTSCQPLSLFVTILKKFPRQFASENSNSPLAALTHISTEILTSEEGADVKTDEIHFECP